jgi:predicted small secreted protein
MTRLIVALSLLMSMLALSGCNTVRGFGEDLEKAGEAISNATKK